jgi:hypothetical protein
MNSVQFQMPLISNKGANSEPSDNFNFYKNMEQVDLSGNAGGNVKWHNHF